MSATDAPAGAAGTDDRTQRDEILQSLAVVRQEMLRKLAGDGRIRDESKEKIRVKQAKAVAYIASTELDALEAEYLEEMREDLDEIKASQP